MKQQIQFIEYNYLAHLLLLQTTDNTDGETLFSKSQKAGRKTGNKFETGFLCAPMSSRTETKAGINHSTEKYEQENTNYKQHREFKEIIYSRWCESSDTQL